MRIKYDARAHEKLSERIDILERRHKARLEELFRSTQEEVEEDGPEKKYPHHWN